METKKENMKSRFSHLGKNKLFFITFILLLISGGACVGQTAYVTQFFTSSIIVVNVSTDTIITSIPVGSDPFGVSVSSDGSKVYVTNESSNTVSVIITATNSVLATIPVGANPEGISVSLDGTKLYVANYLDNTVSVINTISNTVSFVIPVGTHPKGLAVSPDGSKVFVANNFGNSVSVINTSTNTVSATIPVGYSPIGITVSPDGSKVYVTQFDGGVGVRGAVSVINTATNSVSALIPVGIHPFGLSVSPDGSKLYVTNQGPPCIFSLINTFTNTVSDSISVGANPFGVSVSPDGNKIYVVNGYSSSVSVISGTTNILVNTILPINGSISLGNFISSFTAPLINTNGVDTIFCLGNNLSVPFNTPDTLNNGNIFTAQLSDVNGSFATPVNIGTLTDTITGTISAIIPSNTPAGTGYRIRVISSNPVATGADNGTDITINPTYNQTVSASICQGSTYTFPDGTIDSVATVHTSHFSAVNACDSSIVTTLTVHSTYNQTVSASICNGSNYTFPDGTIDSIVSVHTSHLNTFNGCDSIITTNLNVITPNDSIFLQIPTCFCVPSDLAVAWGATSYQWIDCNNGNSIIPGEVNSYFMIIQEGNYAVIVNQNGCIDTSDCYYALTEGLVNLNSAMEVSIYPNPFTSQTTITFNEEQKNTTIKIMNLYGDCIEQLTSTGKQLTVDMAGYAKGIYLLQITDENKNSINKKIALQ